jgi:hypothetical protein
MESEKQTDITDVDTIGYNKTPSDLSFMKHKKVQSEDGSSVSSGANDSEKETVRAKGNSTLQSELMESRLISNKENMLGSLVGSNIHFESEMNLPSEIQAKEFIQNVEEGMKEYAIVQDENPSLPTSSERSSASKDGSDYEDTKDVMIPSNNNSFDEDELKNLIESYSQQKQSKFEEIDEKEREKDYFINEYEGENNEMNSNHQLNELLKSNENIALMKSNLINIEMEMNEKDDDSYEEFLSEVQEPKAEEDYMPISYQNSVRNNKLMSELMASGIHEGSNNYLSITNNGVTLKNSGLMMDLGIYEMYKESNLMSGLEDSIAEHEKKMNKPQEIKNTPHEDEILMSAIQMKDSGFDAFTIEPRNSLDKLKAKVIENGGLIDSSLFSKRELDSSKRKSLKYESSKQVNFKKEPIKPLISEMGIGVYPKPVLQFSKNTNPENKFVKLNQQNDIFEQKFEEIYNEDEIYISEIKKDNLEVNPHMIVDTIIPELGINIRQNDLQDSLTAYDESQKNIYNDPDMIKDQFLKNNYSSQMSISMTVDEERKLEQQRKEIEEFDLLIQSKISNMEEDAFVYKGSDDEEEFFKEN